jgi:hypothetical protein
MPAAVAIEDFLARQADLDGSAGDARKMSDDDLVIEGVGLAAEAASVRRGDDADPRRRHLKDLRERAVDVVRRLRRRPEGELSVGAEVRQRGVLFEGDVRAALVEKEVLVDAVGVREPSVDVAELHRDELVEVARVAVVVDARLGSRDGVFDRADRRQRLVVDFDRIERVERRVFVDRGDGGDGVSHVTNAVERERVLVLRHRKDPERDREVPTGRGGDDSGHPERLRHVDAGDPGVSHGRAEEPAVQHPGKEEIVGELRLAGHLGRRVDLRERAPDDPSLHRTTGSSPDSSKSVP